MELSLLGVRVAAGSLRGTDGVVLPHVWTEAGALAAPAANGAHLLHLSVALCVLNDTYREADALGISLDGVAVEADGGFDDAWRSTGIGYELTIDSAAPAADLARLRSVVDEVAEIPRAIRAGAAVSPR